MTVTDEATVVNLHGRDDRRQPKSWTDSPRRIVIAFVIAFIYAEVVGAFFSIPAQAALDAAFAFGAVNYAIFGWRTTRIAGLVMAALFTSRLLVLTLPATDIAVTTRIGIIAGLSIGLAYIATWVLSVDISSGRSNESYPLRKPLVSRSFTAAATILSGFPIGFIAYLLLTPAPLAVQDLFGSAILPWAVAVGAIGLGAFGEELLFRRLVGTMVRHAGGSQTPWISAAIYGSVFLATMNVGVIALMTAAGALFAWSCERTGSIRPVVIAHAIAGILLYVILPN